VAGRERKIITRLRIGNNFLNEENISTTDSKNELVIITFVNTKFPLDPPNSKNVIIVA
jgi:hypothetical protein